MGIFFSLLIGAVVGSFMNVVALRIPRGEKLGGRSMCPHCRTILSPRDLVPIASFCILRGRCRSCRRKISWQYPLVELGTALLFATALLARTGESGIPQSLSDWGFLARDWFAIAVLLVVFLHDLRFGLVFDRVVLPGTAIVLFANGALSVSWQSLALGVAVGAGVFLLQYLASRGRWIGAGDIRLGAFMGALLGFPGVLVALFFAYTVGALVGLILVKAGKKTLGSKIPFGTFLAPATVFALFCGDAIISWYMQMLV
jgi:prepilin signal peptidase PulO-like enzyme (type II secretory pathway)